MNSPKKPHVTIMKRFPLIICVIAIWSLGAQAGPERYSSKDTVVPPPCPSWYADNEWNVSIWGAHAFTDNDYPAPGNTITQGITIRLDGTRVHPAHDNYLEADRAWGGGIDAKYFFRRYFGVGLEGYGLNARRSFGTVTVLPPLPGMIGTNVESGTGHEERLICGLLGTFTFRYPIGSSRFAPYAWVGGGAIFRGGELDETRVDDIPAGAIIQRFHRGSETKAIGQFGGGFEVRLTPHIGWTNDFSWNVVEGSSNNFGMVRSGINFAF
jgi:hypothetical protein